MQAYKIIIQSICIDFVVFVHGRRFKRDSANVQTHQRRSRASPVCTLIVFLPIFQISHKWTWGRFTLEIVNFSMDFECEFILFLVTFCA